MRAAARNRAACLGWLAFATLAACRGERDAHLVVVVTAAGSPPAVAALAVTLRGSAGASTARYSPADQQPIVFPTTLSATVPARAAGDLTLEVEATDPGGATVASGRLGPITVRPGHRETVYVQVDCGGGPCMITGGGSREDGGAPSTSPRCGNGRIDPGESCDVTIPRGAPGACPPPGCDDGIACTKDVQTGEGCSARCTHEEVQEVVAGDGCCPAGQTSLQDPDCSSSCGNGALDPKELCDRGIAPGAPGACPDAGGDSGADACAETDPCLTSWLVSAGTCSATCARYPVAPDAERQMAGDGCCPPGGTNASDRDCPVACGNGVKEDGESCDVAIPAPAPGSCAASCDDGDSCTNDFVAGSGCQAACVHVRIGVWLSGDGCCPPGATPATDTDCPSQCGNGVVEKGEACDSAAAGPGACPTSCPPSPSPCLTISLVGSKDDCSARCLITPVTTCSGATSDECCPSGCHAGNDSDCTIFCGDGVIQKTLGEHCDIGEPGSCPTSCSSSNPCTEARLVSAGTCSAQCVFLPITGFRAGDGCCPPGGNFTLDPDCPIQCGNGIVEPPGEPCDHAVGNGSCPAPQTGCPAAGACTITMVEGSVAACTAMCVELPITGCVHDDGCCAPGCSNASDDDCPVLCGDGVVGGGERCDRAIPTGSSGACLHTCDDGDACTLDVASGSVEGCSRACSSHPITACVSGDGCCPPGCSAAGDEDCNARCNDGRIGAGETCDPPATCPTTCPDDGDPCTAERLLGSPSRCDVSCRHEPRTTCSGRTADSCCPTGCTAATDTDC